MPVICSCADLLPMLCEIPNDFIKMSLLLQCYKLLKERVQARVIDIDQLRNYRNLIRDEQAQQFLPNAPSRPNVRNIPLQVLPSIHEEREQNPPIHVQPPYNPACPQNIPTCPCGTQAVRCQAVRES